MDKRLKFREIVEPAEKMAHLTFRLPSAVKVLQLRADSNVADKWINGHYAMGKRYKDNIGGIQIRGRRRKNAYPVGLIDDNVKHHFREPNQEADHFAKMGIVGHRKLKGSQVQGGMERDARVLGRKHQRQRKEWMWTCDRSRRQRGTVDCKSQQEIGAQDILLDQNINLENSKEVIRKDPERYQNRRQQKGRQGAMRTLAC